MMCGDPTPMLTMVGVNGQTWDKESLTTMCDLAGTPVQLNVATQDCNSGHDGQESTCCWDPYTQQYITELTVYSLTPDGATTVGKNCPSSMPYSDCCSPAMGATTNDLEA